MKIKTCSIVNKPTLTDSQVSEGFALWDITVKSGCDKGYWLAPNWELVNDWQSGKITWEIFRERYFKIVSKRWNMLTQKTKDVILYDDIKVILLCYCSEKKHCHRILAAEFLCKHAGATYYGEHQIF